MTLSLSKHETEVYSQYSQLALPRHTSYPAVPFWKEQETLQTIHSKVASRTSREGLSLYFHIPFCQQLCFYCGCSKEIREQASPKTQERVEALIDGIAQELVIKQPLLQGRKVEHIHFGGGTPTFLSQNQWQRLWELINQAVSLTEDAELAIEIDPRTVSRQALSFLRNLGFNRISLGVQDFNPVVQKAVNRIQPFQQVDKTMEWARELGFQSVNFDLIYGLPFQTETSISETISQVIELQPDRIAFYRLAVIPELFKWQKSFLAKDLPSGLLPLKLNLVAINQLEAAGYQFLGLDHFAKKDDELSKAFRNNCLHRNFQGMTAGKDQNILGFGPTSISDFGDLFFQNPRTLEEWISSVQNPVVKFKCHALTQDDRIRRKLIQNIYSYGLVDIQNLEDEFHIQFDKYFNKSQAYIDQLVRDGVIDYRDYVIQENGLLGRLMRRVFASVFDYYLPEERFTLGIPGKASQVG